MGEGRGGAGQNIEGSKALLPSPPGAEKKSL
jgi:hypothetical protein